MILGKMSDSTYNSTTGLVEIVLDTSTIVGYGNTTKLFSAPNIMSLPLEGQEVNIDDQAPTQMHCTGFVNKIIDENYSLAKGEITIASPTKWYLSARTTGLEAQEALTANKENFMMGQSTNKVLNDIMSLLINIIGTLGTMQTQFDLHTHISATPGDPTGVPGVSIPPIFFPTPPDDSDVVDDNDYITANKNLAITGTYEPK